MTFLRRCVLGLFGLAFLNASSGSAHLHLCLDGQGPRGSVHVFDRTQDLHPHGVSQGHHDVDVRLTDQTLAKVVKFGTSGAPVAPPRQVPGARLPGLLSGPFIGVEPPVPAGRALLPPKRGPPA